MKQIALNKSQKKKFIEMCEILFLRKEHKKESQLRHFFTVTNAGFVKYSTLSSESPFEKKLEFKMHWYEFCMTQLTEKVLNPAPEAPNRAFKSTIKDFFWRSNLYWYNTAHEKQFGLGKEHPIDMLYNIFSKEQNMEDDSE